MDLQDLLRLPASSITAIDVASFLALRLPESRLHDYKANIDAALKTIAAFANTNGGLVMVGITDKALEVVGVKNPGQAITSLHNMCWTVLDPAFSPEIIPIELDGKTILLVRVDHADVRRPVFHKGTVYYRMGDSSTPADRNFVQALFAEGPARTSGGTFQPTGASNLASHDDRRLTLRAIISSDLPRRTLAPIFTGTPLRTAVQAALRIALVTEWLRRFDKEGSWTIAGHNSSQAATWQWLPASELFEATVVLELTGLPVPSLATAWLDVGVRMEADAQLSLDDLYWLFHSLVATATRTLGPAIFGTLMPGPWIANGPRCILDTAQTPLQDLVSLGEQGVVANLRPHPMRADLWPTQLWPTSDEAIRTQVQEWLTRLALDCGLLGAEASIAGLPV